MFWFYILGVILLLIIYVKYKHSYWKRHGLYQIEPEFFVGNCRKEVTAKLSIGEASLEKYKKIKSENKKHGGIYLFLEPHYMPIDPKIIKHILQTDFSHFMDHGFFHHPNDVLTMNLFNLNGTEWRKIRAKLSPTFSAVKVKNMFGILLEKKTVLEKVLDVAVKTDSGCNIKDILSRFTIDVIGSCAFGIETNSLENPKIQLREYSKKIFEPNPFKIIVSMLIPWEILGRINFKFYGPELTNYFSRIVKETIEYREKNQINRKDFLHLLNEMKNNGIMSNGSSKETCKTENNTLTIKEIIAHCYGIFIAGFGTSASTATSTLLELARHQEIQEKLRQEIHNVLTKYNGEITYDAIMEMKYLDNVIDESLRLYPALPYLPRECTKRYKVPGTDLIIEKGTKIDIPVWGIHTDPDYYPNPEQFNPDNFNEENKAKRPDFTYMPFGEGPRICVGMRFGKVQTKFVIVTLLTKYKFFPHEKTQFPLKMHPGDLVLSISGDVWLNLKRI